MCTYNTLSHTEKVGTKVCFTNSTVIFPQEQLCVLKKFRSFFCWNILHWIFLKNNISAPPNATDHFLSMQLSQDVCSSQSEIHGEGTHMAVIGKQLEINLIFAEVTRNQRCFYFSPSSSQGLRNWQLKASTNSKLEKPFRIKSAKRPTKPLDSF